jgi:Flp pilus assembly protein TadG
MRDQRLKRRRRGARGAVLLEFVLTLPLTLVMTMFIIDAGRVFVVAGAANDAAWRAAKTASVRGTYDQTAVENAFFSNMSSAPAGVRVTSDNTTLEDVTAKTTGVPTACTAANRTIKVRATIKVGTLTPGLLTLLGSTSSWDGWTVSVLGVGACEKVQE